MTTTGIRTLIVAGGGTAGWMTAAILATKLRHRTQLSIILVESDDLGAIGVGESTLPAFVRFHANILGLDEAEFMHGIGATFKLGIRFEDWVRPGHVYYHPFYKKPDSNPVPFHHHWLHGRVLGERAPYHAYSREATAAGMGVFDKSALTYAYQIDAVAYAAYMRNYAEARGVRRVEGRIAGAALDGDAGTVKALILADGRRIEGDFFIDCTGFRGVLIEQALKTGYEDWSHFLPCDRAVAVPAAQDRVPGPFTRAIARPHGWQWKIPLQHRSGNGYVYCSALCSDDEAAALLLDNLDGEPLAQPLRLRFSVGRRRLFWNKNCVAIGLSASFLEPLEASGIALIQLAIYRLMQLFPNAPVNPAQADAFNREMGDRHLELRDLLMFHYHANERRDSEFWTACRERELPESLRQRIDLFRSCGQIVAADDDSFAASSWVHVMLGQELMPTHYHPFVAAYGPAENARLLWTLAKYRQAIRKAAEKMPAHSAFLDRICAPARAAGGARKQPEADTLSMSVPS